MKRLIFLLLAFVFVAASTLVIAAITPDSSIVKFDEIGMYRLGYIYRGHDAVMFPDGWTGFFEDHTGIACQSFGTHLGKNAFLLHVPWRGGVGITFQEFSINLPKVAHITLRGAIAMMPLSLGKSDGVTFRVYVNGNKLMDTNRTESQWKDFDFDLTEYAGSVATIRFEVDSGPKDDSNWDYSVWGDRELVLDGFQVKNASRVSAVPLNMARMTSANNGSMVPASGYTSKVQMKLDSENAVFTYKGADGVMEYRWSKPTASDMSPFGQIRLTAKMTGDRPAELGLGNGAVIEWIGEGKLVSSKWQQSAQGISCISEYTVGQQTAHLTMTGKLVGKNFILDVTCDKPIIQRITPGGWGPVLRRRQVTVPYYPGQVYFLPSENLFVNTFYDWHQSMASSNESMTAVYGALTDRTRNVLKERVVYSAAWHLAEVLPNIPNPASPYLKEIGGKIVLDTWGGNYTDIADKLKMLSDYGITNCMVIIHVWQRSGYDNALPMHIPADPSMGGDPGMKILVNTATKLGFRIALHENYVDYYTNYDFYNENDIALDSAGNKELAWFNPGTKMQSFAVKPNAILRLAATQSPEIHKRYGTNANYLDVHSCVPLWFHVDFRAGEPGAGTMKPTWNAHKDLWAYERKIHGGPVFGEGNGHWIWSGLLDGVEGQFGSGWPSNGGLEAPLMVDFDITKIHPLQSNHGMGYYERWWSSEIQWGSRPPMVVLDQYRMQEVAYGHIGFLAGSTWSTLPLTWLEHNLLTPVSARYSAAKVKTISYMVDGKWLDSTSAAKLGQWQIVKIAYDNGLVVTANNSKSSITAIGIELPQYGWLAKGAGVFAYSGYRNGVFVDYSQTKTSYFANARSSAEWMESGIKNIEPTIGLFTQTGPRAFRVSYNWRVGEALSEDLNCFVHVSKTVEDAGIDFQQDHTTKIPSSKWKAGTNVEDGPYDLKLPDGLADGDYMWHIGLWAPNSGRVSLEGVGDGRGRIKLGILRVRNAGKVIEFIPEPKSDYSQNELYHKHLNDTAKVVDFGAVRTNGSVQIKRTAKGWALQSLPRDDNFIVELNTKVFGSPKYIKCDKGASATVKPILQNGWCKLQLNGAKRYSW